MLAVFAFLSGLCFVPADVDDSKSVQGKWKVVTVLENGKSLTEQQIASQLVVDGYFTFDGLVISFLPPGQFEQKKIPFVLNASVDPKTIDLMGVAKIGATGIYLLSGDSLMLSFPGPNEKARPKDFSNVAGGNRILVVLQRSSISAPAKTTSTALPTPPATQPTVNPATTANSTPTTNPMPTNPTPPAAKLGVTPTITPAWSPVPALPSQIPPVTSVMQDMRQKLIGTWGHQTEESVVYYTLNADGTFSSTIDWKSGIKNTFKSDQRASGTWNLNNGVIIATITASTESQLRNQVFSWRITNMGDRDLIAVDNTGKLRHEWKVR